MAVPVIQGKATIVVGMRAKPISAGERAIVTKGLSTSRREVRDGEETLCMSLRTAT